MQFWVFSYLFLVDDNDFTNSLKRCHKIFNSSFFVVFVIALSPLTCQHPPFICNLLHQSIKACLRGGKCQYQPKTKYWEELPYPFLTPKIFTSLWWINVHAPSIEVNHNIYEQFHFYKGGFKYNFVSSKIRLKLILPQLYILS